MEKKMDNLWRAKDSIEALLNYNKCDKHCEQPHTVCCCRKSCMSKNKDDLAYSMDDVNNGIEYILDYFKRVGREMSE